MLEIRGFWAVRTRRPKLSVQRAADHVPGLTEQHLFAEDQRVRPLRVP